MIQTERLESIPAGENPFLHDAFHMGMCIGKNVIIMAARHETMHLDYIIVINVETGERLKIKFQETSKDDVVTLLVNTIRK